ncbi:MAG: hypothetical protein CL878_08805 [Dehalococcoidia bacterium]|nr:hypothetical protein [Dehalococcoidia bacterium]
MGLGNCVDAALAYARRGWAPIVVPRGQKSPKRRGGQKQRLTEDDIPKHFGGSAKNVGVLLGEPSGGLVDVDLDTPEAVLLAPYFLPKTGARFGRPSNPNSHWLYQCDSPPRTERYADPLGGTMLVELRSDGCQTIFPPSVHPSGEQVAWEQYGEPASCDGSELRRRVGMLGAAALLVCQYPAAGSRDGYCMGLIGYLLKGGMQAAYVEALITAVVTVADDEEVATRVDKVQRAVSRLGEGKPLAGLSKLRDVMGDEQSRTLSEALRRWLGLSQGVSDLSDPLDIPVQPFPTDTLPAVFREFVAGYSRALGVPPEYVALPLLTCAGAAMGRMWRLSLKNTWQETAQLFTAVVAPPGSAKSPALRHACYPLTQLQKDADERFEGELEGYKAKVDEWETAKAEGHTGQKEKPVKPRREHFYTVDVTVEALGPIVQGSSGVAVIRDELVGWIKSCDAYRGGLGGDRQFWMSVWSGWPIRVNRKTSEQISVDRAVIGVTGGIQPDMLYELADQRGRLDGFVERILFIFPDPVVSLWTDDDVEQDAIDAVVDVFRLLRDPPCEVKADLALSEYVTVTLSPKARQCWKDWFNDNQVRTSEADGISRGWYAKLPNHCARLAVILHAAHHPHGTEHILSLDTMEAAIQLAEYFRSHAHRALSVFEKHRGSGATSLGTRVLKILGRANGGWVRRSDIHKSLGGSRPVTDVLTATLKKLEDRGVIKHQRTTTDGRPLEEWRLIQQNSSL